MHASELAKATVRVENFEVFLISRFSLVADDTKIITRGRWNYYPRNFYIRQNQFYTLENFHSYGSMQRAQDRKHSKLDWPNHKVTRDARHKIIALGPRDAAANRS